MGAVQSHSYYRVISFVVVLLVLRLVSEWSNNRKDEDHHDVVSDTMLSPLKYNALFSSNENEEGRTLNVHVVAHTHDDVGWLKTVDQYFEGWNNSIQHVCVDDILTSVIEALMENPHRTFTYVEQKFFTMWWDRQNDAVRDAVRVLVHNKQLTFVNGGWCMHDEAATHFMGMIDQTTLGHSFLKKEFGFVPKVGWQLDPFGHSSSQASLLTYRMGFDALYFGRIDYQDLSKRHADRECEGLWNASTSWEDSTVFWGLAGSYGGNYGAPTGFCFDVHCDDFHPLTHMSRPELIRALQNFLLQVRQQADRTKGNHVMLTMGSDFQYQRASINFANLDLLMGTIQHIQQWKSIPEIDIPAMFGPQYDKVNIFYSSPDYYTQCKYNETVQRRERNKRDVTENEKLPEGMVASSTLRSLSNIASASRKYNASLKDQINNMMAWTVKQDDFFPYSDCPNCFWTGYFTSRPALKRLERVSSSFLMASRQLEALLDYNQAIDPVTCETPMHVLEDATGVIQHHDGVSGTSKQHVAYDYAKRVQAGMDGVTPCLLRKIKRQLLGSDADRYLQDFSYCQLLNETKCHVAQQSTLEGRHLYVVLYNSLAQQRSTLVKLPVADEGKYDVEEVVDNIESAPHGCSRTISAHRAPFASGGTNNDSFVLTFTAHSLPPLGAKTFRVRKSSSQERVTQQKELTAATNNWHVSKVFDDVLFVSHSHFSVQINVTTGNIVQIGRKAIENLTTWGYYKSFDWKRDRILDNDHQNSGAYIFRPSTPTEELHEIHPINANVINSTDVVEVHVAYKEPWIQTITRIARDVPYVDIEYQVGPIPSHDGRGREVVVRYNTMVNNNSTFYTDSNGREFIKRIRNHRPTWALTVYEPVAGNYYPVNAALYVEGDSHDKQAGSAFAVVTDRTQGGSSLRDGTVELMVHRKTLVDDWRGVAEPINETDGGITPNQPWGNATRIGKGIVIRGVHRILVPKNEETTGKSGASLARSAMDEAFAEPMVFVGSAKSDENVPFARTSFSGLKESFPSNVMLLTKRLLYEKPRYTYLIRLGHQYGIGDDPILSKPVSVSLDLIFPKQSIQSVQETTLSGNRDVVVWLRERHQWIVGRNSALQVEGSNTTIASDGSHVVTLLPMDIRTFTVRVK